jgi:hypothetical protein
MRINYRINLAHLDPLGWAPLPGGNVFFVQRRKNIQRQTSGAKGEKIGDFPLIFQTEIYFIAKDIGEECAPKNRNTK